MITDRYDASRVDGGVQAVTKYLVEALVALGEIELHLVAFRYGSGSGSTSVEDGYTRHLLPGGRLGTLTAFAADQRRVDTCLAAIRPDVVHAQGAGHNGILACRSPWPTVVTIHGIMAEEARHYTGLVRRTRQRLLSRLSERWCIARARHTILISPYVERYYGERLGGEHYMIPNPIADDFFDIARREDPARVLFAGRLYALKGVRDLVEAIARVAQSRPVELALAGSLQDRAYVRELEETAARLGIADRVHFLGLLDETALRGEIARAAVLALPSCQETAPMVLAEAMAAGVPVVASSVGGVPFQVEDGKDGFLFEPGDVEALADRLVRLLADDALRQAFSAAAKARAAREYRAAEVARRTMNVYRAAAASKNRSCSFAQ